MKNRLFVRIAGLLLAALLSACGGGTDSSSGNVSSGGTGGTTGTGNTGGSTSTTSNYDYIFSTSKTALSVSVSKQLGDSSSKTIPASGGTISLKASDGTFYTLDIPADALLVATTITMTPTTVSGMPFGSPQKTYAVHLEPEGLRFNNYVTLTIAPTVPIPVDQQIFFGYQGDGRSLGLAPPTKDSSKMQIRLLHFSGYGATMGYLAELDAVRQQLGGDAEARLTSEAALTLMQMRQNPNSDSTALLPLYARFKDEVLKPRIAAASQSCAAARLAFDTATGYDRMMGLLNAKAPGEPETANAALIDTVNSVCMKEEYELCRDKHVVHRMAGLLQGVKRQYALLGTEDSSPVVAQAKDYAKRCLKFELQFESYVHVTVDTKELGFTVDSNSKSTIPLQFDTNTLKVEAQASLINDYLSLTPIDFRCSYSGLVIGSGTFQVYDMGLDSTPPSDGYPYGALKDVALHYFNATTLPESFMQTCQFKEGAVTVPWNIPYWQLGFYGNHESDLSPVDYQGQQLSVFLASGWKIEPPGGDLLASNSWMRTSSKTSSTETGGFKLYHRPQ